MKVETLSQEEMMGLASKVLGDESGLQALARDVRAKAAVALREEKAAEADLERVKAKIVACKTSRANWDTFSTILGGLVEKWGIQDIAVLPSKERTQEDPDPAPTPQRMDPVTQARMDAEKNCMFRDQKTKKWCPTGLSKSQKKKSSIYCAKHHTLVNGG